MIDRKPIVSAIHGPGVGPALVADFSEMARTPRIIAAEGLAAIGKSDHRRFSGPTGR